MEKLRDRLKTTVAWNWTEENTKKFNKLKIEVRADAEKGIKRPSGAKDASLVLISDWSRFCLYEVCCDHSKD